MPTTLNVKIQFDDAGGQIGREGGGFVLRDQASNELKISLRAVLRCLAIAEHEKLVRTVDADDFLTRAAGIR